MTVQGTNVAAAIAHAFTGAAKALGAGDVPCRDELGAVF